MHLIVRRDETCFQGSGFTCVLIKHCLPTSFHVDSCEPLYTRYTCNLTTQTVQENDEEDSHVNAEPGSFEVDTSGPYSSAYQEFNAPSTNAMETKLTTDDNNLTETKSVTDDNMIEMATLNRSSFFSRY